MILPQSRYIYSSVLPALYTTVELKSLDRCSETLAFLLHHPELACRVKKLILHPTRSRRSLMEATSEPSGEAPLSDAVEELARTGSLAALQNFVWDGFETPNDRMWLTLRVWYVLVIHGYHVLTYSPSRSYNAVVQDSELSVLVGYVN